MDVVTDWTGTLAALLRQAYHSSQDEFAKRLGVGLRTVQKWEKYPDLKPEPLQQQMLDMFLWQAPEHVKARFGLLLQGPPASTPPPPTPAPRQEWTDDDMNRRELLRIFSMAGALIATPYADDALDLDRLGHAGRNTPVDLDATNQYEALNAHLWQVFMLAGAKGKVYPLVQDQLSTLVRSMQRPTSQAAHARLCTLAGDLFQLAGEIFFDGNQYTEAAHCYTLAASASKEAGAWDLWACAMTRHAFIGVYERRFADAEPMLDLAARLARRGDSSLSTRHWVEVVRAETLAGLGDFDGCQRALDSAEEVRGLTGPVHNGGWLRFGGERLPEERGTCYITLRRPDLAEEVLTNALTHTLSTRRRGGVLVDLAALGVQQGDRDKLLDYGRTAVALARQTGSGVIGQKLRGLQAQMAALTTDHRVRALNDDIDALTAV
ncbi:transcriptional regulator [Nonomuraea wenchangensis]